MMLRHAISSRNARYIPPTALFSNKEIVDPPGKDALRSSAAKDSTESSIKGKYLFPTQALARFFGQNTWLNYVL
jgi:hypothetical protein